MENVMKLISLQLIKKLHKILKSQTARDFNNSFSEPSKKYFKTSKILIQFAFVPVKSAVKLIKCYFGIMRNLNSLGWK